MTSFLSILQGHAARQTDAPAIIIGTEPLTTLTYAELFDRVARLSAWLLAEGLEPGAPCGITVEDPVNHLAAALALLCLGTPQVGLASHETDANVAGIVARIGVRQVVADRDKSWMAGMRVLLPPFGRLPSASGREVPFVEGMPPIYHTTSGSTAVSRSVEFPMARLLLLKDRIAERPRDRRVLRGPGIEFDATRIQRIGCLLAGNTCVFGSFDRPAELAELCRRAEVTVIQLGAYALNGLAWSEEAVSLPSFTQVSVGGQRVPGSLRRRVIDRLTPNLWVQYATTEVGEISRAAPEEHERFPEGVGIPPAHVTVEIVDDHDQPVAPGETGNIRVRKNVAPTSYVDDPVASRAFRGGFFHTGDLGSWRPGEPLIHHGRADDLMILNGINIRPAAIEDRLAAHPDVREAVAFPIRSRVHGEIPAAAVVRAGGDTDARALLAFCRETLGIRAPREIFIVDAMPRSTAGKPLRRALSERFSPARRAGG